MALTTYISTANNFSQWASKINTIIDLLDYYKAAANISFVPSGNLSSTTVQTAIIELQSEVYSTTNSLGQAITNLNNNLVSNVNSVNASIANLSAQLSANVTALSNAITQNTATRLAKTADLADLNNTANARINLGLGDVAVKNGANVTEFLSWTSTKPLTIDVMAAAAGFSNVTYSTTVTLDLNSAINFAITLTGAVAFANPNNPKVGQSGVISITQDSTGSRAATWGGNFKWESGIVPNLTTTANAVDIFSYFVASNTRIIMSLIRDTR